MQKKRSTVWRHFLEEGDNKVSCRTCHKQLTKHGNTSMMLRHLRGKHPELAHCLLDTEGPTVTGEDSWLGDDGHVDEVIESLPHGDLTNPGLDRNIFFQATAKKKRSTVWKHFREEGSDKVACRICNEKLAKHGNTSSMLRHLRGKHPQLKLGELQGESKKLNRLHLRSSNSEARFLSVCERLLRNNQLTDCTLVADGQFVACHRLVLATCSESFEEMFRTVMQPNPVVILRDVSITELRGLINYMYKGETLVKSHELPGLLRAASQLKIKGLSQVGLSESWLEDQPRGGPSCSSHLATPSKSEFGTFYHEDQEMDDLDDETDHHTTPEMRHKKQPQNPLNLMMCEDELEEGAEGGQQAKGTTLVMTEDGGERTLKRVQIKLERNAVDEDEMMGGSEVAQTMEIPIGSHQEEFLGEEEVVIHHEALDDPPHPQEGIQRTTISIKTSGEDGAKEGPSGAGDSMTSILRGSSSMVRMPAPQQPSTSAMSEGGLILLGLEEGESSQRVFPGPSTSSESLRPGPPRKERKYTKQDLFTALNLIKQGHLGIKPAARAFNIPVATLYNATKRHDIVSPLQQGANRDSWKTKGSLLVSTDGTTFQCMPHQVSLPDSS